MKYLLILIVVIAFAIGIVLEAPLPPSLVWDNNSALQSIESEQYFDAEKKLMRNLEEQPSQAELHYNLGLTFHKSKEEDKAVAEYKVSDQLTRDPETSFRARFNAGHVYQSKNDVDSALAAYQAALDIHPDSKEIKNNIEALFLKKSGKGGGEGEKKDQEDKNDGKNQDSTKPRENNNPQPKEKQKPKPFDSKDLSKKDVDKILNEFKRQENELRGRIYHEKSKDKDPEKNW